MTPGQNPEMVVLAILDGWGVAQEYPGNAISLAETPNMDKFWHSYPHTQLEAAGEAVGLPQGEDGNTETGHINLGAGRIIYQDLERINMSIADGSFFENKILLSAMEHSKKYESGLHLMGLVGGGGVHSNISHLFALIHLASINQVKKLYIHIFTDGRDSPPTSAKTYVAKIKEVLTKEGVGQIVSIMGRYWAMDRDQRWDRTELAYMALTKGRGDFVKSPEEAIENSYQDGKTDEFIKPSIIVGNDGKPIANVSENDTVIFFNFRIDRPRQLTKAFVLSDFRNAYASYDFNVSANFFKNTLSNINKNREPFARGDRISNLFFVTMTDYGKSITDVGAIPAFPPEVIEETIGSIIYTSGLRQLRITESEKERFVTFYFNGLREKPFPLEDRIIIPSLKIPTYDQKPEMCAYELTKTLLAKIETKEYKFIVVNFPNADMVGHTGNIGPAVKAIEILDECIGKIATTVTAHNGALIITADHGNAEDMINVLTGEIDTEHSTSPVPFIVVYNNFLGKPQTLTPGILADVSPTILSLLGLTVPPSMTGRNLLSEIVL